MKMGKLQKINSNVGFLSSSFTDVRYLVSLTLRCIVIRMCLGKMSKPDICSFYVLVNILLILVYQGVLQLLILELKCIVKLANMYVQCAHRWCTHGHVNSYITYVNVLMGLIF